MALEIATTRTTSLQQPTEPVQRNFNDQERRAVGYFYGRLKAIYTNQYDALFKDARMIEASKRTWAVRLIIYNRTEMDKGLDWVQDQQINHVHGWEFCSIGKCVGAIKQANQTKACHKPFEKDLALEDQGAKDRAEIAGHSAIADMKGLFND